MAFFNSNKKVNSIVKKVRPTVVKTENVAKEISTIAKEFDVKPESLDFSLLDVRTYTRFLHKDASDAGWEEIDNDRLRDFDKETLLNPDFQIKQIYEIEIFTRQRSKDPFEEFRIAIGANATKC